jgi:hypothetical protein
MPTGAVITPTPLKPVGRRGREVLFAGLPYGEASEEAASWQANDGGRQRKTACPLLYRYRLTQTYCSLARLPPTHPFLLGALILQPIHSVPSDLHFQVRWHTGRASTVL